MRSPLLYTFSIEFPDAARLLPPLQAEAVEDQLAGIPARLSATLRHVSLSAIRRRLSRARARLIRKGYGPPHD
jgi:DNA-directed RNA polymerase specialized sigma24 family protein